MTRQVHENAVLLRAIGRQHGVRVRSENALDTNVGVLARETSRFRHRLGIELRGRCFAMHASDEFVSVEARGELEVGVCSINRADRIFMTRPAEPPIVAGGLSVFVNPPPSEATARFLASRALAVALERLALRPAESVHAYNNALVAYLQSPLSVERLLAAADTLGVLVDEFEVAPPADPISDLPAPFRSLAPLVRIWNLTDDQERTDRIETASEAELHQLVSRVEPKLARVNAYLDSFGDEPLSEAACALQALALSAVEARMRLGS